MIPILWILCLTCALVAVSLIVTWILFRIQSRRWALLDAAVQGHKDRQLQRCPNCWHPFSEWFLHEGCMYCLLCGPFGEPDYVSDHATHAEWREQGEGGAACVI